MFKNTIYHFLTSILSLIYYWMSVEYFYNPFFEFIGTIAIMTFFVSSCMVFVNTFKATVLPKLKELMENEE